MKIALGCDHGGFALKLKIAAFLGDAGYFVCDFGTDSTQSCDYPDFAFAAARAVSSGECEFGVLVCRTGIGMSIAANKVRGVRCALCMNEEAARLTRLHNDANVLALGADLLSEKEALAVVETFLKTEFSGEARHKRRVDKIIAAENDGEGA